MNKKEIIEIVRNAINLISDENKWTMGWLARNADGCHVFSLSPSACKWCAAGALLKVGATIKFIEEIDKFLFKTESNSIGEINDFKGREKVISVLENYINSLE
jgi:hypothetical protein